MRVFGYSSPLLSPPDKNGDITLVAGIGLQIAIVAGELGNAVQDAFVIAVEQQARERLQRLSALKRITPLNQQSQAKGGATQDLSFLKEASPIYLATLSEGELEPLDEPEYESSGNISRGGTEVLLGDQHLRQENR
uniref:Uncharacterized protein n=1 Tax=Anopheles albimanus TaxID=7167 RepID=A0A182FQZ9_ANOAL